MRKRFLYLYFYGDSSKYFVTWKLFINSTCDFTHSSLPLMHKCFFKSSLHVRMKWFPCENEPPLSYFNCFFHSLLNEKKIPLESIFNLKKCSSAKEKTLNIIFNEIFNAFHIFHVSKLWKKIICDDFKYLLCSRKKREATHLFFCLLASKWTFIDLFICEGRDFY